MPSWKAPFIADSFARRASCVGVSGVSVRSDLRLPGRLRVVLRPLGLIGVAGRATRVPPGVCKRPRPSADGGLPGGDEGLRMLMLLVLVPPPFGSFLALRRLA